jgi:hypothetical protein
MTLANGRLRPFDVVAPIGAAGPGEVYLLFLNSRPGRAFARASSRQGLVNCGRHSETRIEIVRGGVS